jgi:hypothetical protein
VVYIGIAVSVGKEPLISLCVSEISCVSGINIFITFSKYFSKRYRVAYYSLKAVLRKLIVKFYGH